MIDYIVAFGIGMLVGWLLRGPSRNQEAYWRGYDAALWDMENP